MKITNNDLKNIIKQEIKNVLNEQNDSDFKELSREEHLYITDQKYKIDNIIANLNNELQKLNGMIVFNDSNEGNFTELTFIVPLSKITQGSQKPSLYVRTQIVGNRKKLQISGTNTNIEGPIDLRTKN